MTLVPACVATAIGSFPHTDSTRLIEKILEWLPDIPVWPQLPNRSFLESMYAQASEGLPCAVVDPERGKVYFDTSKELYAELERFYERVVAEDLSAFRMSEERAAGLHAFLRLLSNGALPSTTYTVKGHLVGPVSFGLTVTDQNKRSVLYHEELYEAIVQGLALKARWQAEALSRLRPHPIFFVDEPYLSAIGSAFVSLTREQVVASLEAMFSAIVAAGAVPGIHCCGNTDWSILMDTSVRILNFDAWENFEGLSLYPDRLKRFLEGGGMLAWGIVPTSSDVSEARVELLLDRLDQELDVLEKAGLARGRVLAASLITPSCGTGTLTEELCEKVMTLNLSTASRLRDSRQ